MPTKKTPAKVVRQESLPAKSALKKSRSAGRGVADKAERGQTKATTSEPKVFVDADELIRRLVSEVVQGRVRHRALLKTLREGEFNWDAYTSNIEMVERNDAEALFHLLVMNFDAFRQHHANWLENDFALYGFRRRGAGESESTSKKSPEKT